MLSFHKKRETYLENNMADPDIAFLITYTLQ